MASTADDTVAVRCSGLDKSYGAKHVLAGIDLEIRAGERCCFVGTNGSGKTTLLEIIMGLKTPSGGNIEVLGMSPTAPRLKGRRSMLMDRASFPFYAKVSEVVWLYSSFYSKQFSIAELLRSFDLSGDSFVRHLSKGQRQRLGILLALLGKPEIILLDEPTSGLDPQARFRFWEILGGRLEENSGSTLIFATHDLSEAELWADRIGILHYGRLITIRTPEELCRAAIGTRRKVTIVGKLRGEPAAMQVEGVASVARLGPEVALYTDHPERVLQSLALADDSLQFRIENVTVRDAFFKLTGEVPDEAATLAVQKLG
jgi:ABC-2 type transport system ATP-binding protein